MFLKIFTLVIAILCMSVANADQLNYGTYFGSIQIDNSPEAIAVSLDAFIVQIKDPTVYPALNVIVRANLGGYVSSEYVGYNYYDPTFNFEKSILQLDDPNNDFTATLQVTNTDTETILEGPVRHRLSNIKGTMRVVMEMDSSIRRRTSPPFTPILRGEYKGTCGSTPADLQIETGRGLGATAPGNAMTGYSITGRIGFTTGPLCDPKSKQYCGSATFSTGTYSPFSNHVTMQGPLGTIDCTKSQASLNCKLLLNTTTGNCQLSKTIEATTPPSQFPPGFILAVPSVQKQPLPAPLPPDNTDLVNALNGDFYGFLHYENRDVFQLMQMSVVATTSTENPHVQNQVMVTPTVALRLGSSWTSTPALTLNYPQRVFWMNTGFAFEGDDEDLMIVIGNWRSGYLSGVLYSRSFGRVGTFEMQKGSAPALQTGMNLVASPLGDFQGPTDSPTPLKNIWKLSIEIPGQSSANSVGLPLLGRYSGPGVAQMFDAASLDLNSGAVSFLIKNTKGDRLVIGNVKSNGDLNLLWPVGPALGAPMGNYQYFDFAPDARMRK